MRTTHEADRRYLEVLKAAADEGLTSVENALEQLLGKTRAVPGLGHLANLVQTSANPAKTAPEPVERRLQSCNSKITDRRQKLADAKQGEAHYAKVLQAYTERVRQLEEA